MGTGAKIDGPPTNARSSIFVAECMELGAVHSLYDVLADDRFDLLYSGRFSDGNTADLITWGEEVAREKDRTHRQRLSFVMVEAYQNVVRHRAKLTAASTNNDGRSLFLVRSREGWDEVLAMDPVPKHETETLTHALGRIRGSDISQLKELFLARLKDGTRTERGGAGLGLIEMARRSGNSMQHHLLPLDAAHELFLLQIVVGAGPQNVSEVDLVRKVHALVGANDIGLLCRCGSSPIAQECVLNIIERDAKAAHAQRLKRAFLAATEWLQGPGMSERSFIAIARVGEGYALVAGGCVSAAHVARWKDGVQRIAAMSPMERERHYRNSLLGRGAVDDMGAGLLDLARISSDPLGTAFFQVPDGTRMLVACSVR